MNRLLSDLTQKEIGYFVEQPAHALLLIGPTGSGKASLAATLAEQVLGLNSGEFANYAYKMVLANDDSSIGVEAVRQLEQFLSLKVPSHATTNRVIIIEDAQKLTLEAQNALLKNLEEPPQATIFILTTSHAQALLPTVQSRAASIEIKRPDKSQLQQYFEKKGFDEVSINRAYFISGGLPGLMTALLEESDHPLIQATEQARLLLQSSAYERLLLIDGLSKQRELAYDTILMLGQMAHVSLLSAGQTAGRWQKILEASFTATKSLNMNAQPKLVLVNLALAF